MWLLGYEVTPRQLIKQSESHSVGWSNRASYGGSSQAEESMVVMNMTESVEDSQDGVTEGLGYVNRTEMMDWLEVGFLAVEVGVMEGGVMGRVELYGPSARHGM